MRERLESLWQRALDVLAPRECAGCRQRVPGQWCPQCWQQLEPHVAALGDLTVCALGPYDGPLGATVRRLKYHDRPDLAGPLGDTLGRLHASVLSGQALLVPIPLHRARLAQRRYNQAALLARAIARRTGLDHSPRALERLTSAARQAGSSATERSRNVQQAFHARERRLAGATVVLVDDVVTTGATVRAAAGALRAAGASVAVVLCVCRTRTRQPRAEAQGPR